MRTTSRQLKHRKKYGKYKSGLEKRAAAVLGRKVTYETVKIAYVIPARPAKYNPDFIPVKKKNFYIETKGRFVASDRKKHLLIKEQHPHIRVAFIFERPYNTISKKSKTTYADWADKNGFLWTTLEEGIPKDWTQ
jgi:Phage endonuclease I